MSCPQHNVSRRFWTTAMLTGRHATNTGNSRHQCGAETAGLLNRMIITKIYSVHQIKDSAAVTLLHPHLHPLLHLHLHPLLHPLLHLHPSSARVEPYFSQPWTGMSTPVCRPGQNCLVCDSHLVKSQHLPP